MEFVDGSVIVPGKDPIALRGTIRVIEWPYVYFWHRCGRKGHPCRVTARGRMNSCRVEFQDGFVMITSRNAIRKAK